MSGCTTESLRCSSWFDWIRFRFSALWKQGLSEVLRMVAWKLHANLLRKATYWLVYWYYDYHVFLCCFAFKENFDEVVIYLTESIGNPVRIDYGTGHELSFIACLLALFEVGYLKKPEQLVPGTSIESLPELNDYAATALYVMPAYLRLVRHLQTYFRMEPAGSHGVWSLDDFQFVPYIWGSSQLIGMCLSCLILKLNISGTGLYGPSSIPDKEIAAKEAKSCLFFSCINYIFQVKTGPFAEHSSCLQSLCGVPNWQKVNSGMIKMYKGEVCGNPFIVFIISCILLWTGVPFVAGIEQISGGPAFSLW